MKVNDKNNINFWFFFLPQSFQTCFCFLGDRLWSYNTNSCRTFFHIFLLLLKHYSHQQHHHGPSIQYHQIGKVRVICAKARDTYKKNCFQKLFFQRDALHFTASNNHKPTGKNVFETNTRSILSKTLQGLN